MFLPSSNLRGTTFFNRSNDKVFEAQQSGRNPFTIYFILSVTNTLCPTFSLAESFLSLTENCDRDFCRRNAQNKSIEQYTSTWFSRDDEIRFGPPLQPQLYCTSFAARTISLSPCFRALYFISPPSP